MKSYYRNMSKKLKNVFNDIDWHSKEEVVRIIRKYNFIILFAISFAVYMVFLGIQGIFGKGASSKEEDIMAVNVQNISQTDNSLAGAAQGTQGETSTGNQKGNPNINTNQNTTPNANQNQNAVVPAAATFTKADISYLDGALFIGDSRTILLQTYAGWNNTTFYTETGMSIWKVMDSPIASVNGQTMTVDEALQNTKFNKIYIMLGINELGTGTPDTFAQQYANVIARIRQLQPQAVIYIQSIMHVTQERDDKGTFINNDAINIRNDKIKAIADNINVFWLDENEVLDAAENGKLNPEYTSDGIHLKAKYLSVWKDYILSHAIIR